ncbi:hypothetical protein ACV22V_30270 [Burkholderia sp. AW33-5]
MIIEGIARESAARIDGASHLPLEMKAAAKRLLADLRVKGRVQVPDSDFERKQAVGGVQWAMEETLRGVEVIVTPDRPTPFRTHGDSKRGAGQAEREAALVSRLHKGDALHLVFCAGAVGTAEQDAAYRRDIFEPETQSGLLREHYLPISVDAFPKERSGAAILSLLDGKQFAFAIRAAQVDKASNATSLSLYLGDLNSRDEQGVGEIVRDWSDFLLGYGLDAFSMKKVRIGEIPTTQYPSQPGGE